MAIETGEGSVRRDALTNLGVDEAALDLLPIRALANLALEPRGVVSEAILLEAASRHGVPDTFIRHHDRRDPDSYDTQNEHKNYQ